MNRSECASTSIVSPLTIFGRKHFQIHLSRSGNHIKDKDIPITGRGDPWGCETSRIPYFLDDRLTDGYEVSLTRRPSFTPKKIRGTVVPRYASALE
jgi:hypothetical protein